jgi:hypothetical protein
MPDIKKGRIIRPDIRPAGYPVHLYLPYYVPVLAFLLIDSIGIGK